MKKLMLLLSGLLGATTLGGLLALSQPTNVQVGPMRVSITVTATQAVFTYTAPGTGACALQVSEDRKFAALVHDVDPTLFNGSNLDSRTGNLGAGTTARTFVVGRHGMSVPPGGTNEWVASDTLTYSRALQANTVHYFKLTCGSIVQTGSFTTANIPVGVTYSDPAALSGPGAYNFPTLSNTDRTQRIIDPNTGALIKRYTLPGDEDTHYAWTPSGGFHDQCSTVLSNGGYHCAQVQRDGNPRLFYWISPTTGEVRFLGYFYIPGQAGNDGWGQGSYIAYSGDNMAWDWTNANVFYLALGTSEGNYLDPVDGYYHGILLKVTLTGNDVAVAQNTAFARNAENLTLPSSGAGSLIKRAHAYLGITSQKPLWLNLALVASQGDYLLFQLNRKGQDSYGYFLVWQISTAQFIAKADTWATNPTCRWCVNHTVAPTGNHDVLHWELQKMKENPGPFGTTLTQDVAAGDNHIHVAGEPLCYNADPDSCYGLSGGSDANAGRNHSSLMNVAVGDAIEIEETGGAIEYLTITAKTSSTEWAVNRARFGSSAASHASGKVVQMTCNARNASGNFREGFWSFLLDPTGTDETNVGWGLDGAMTGAHYVYRGGYRIMSGGDYTVKTGVPSETMDDPIAFAVSFQPPFHGVTAVVQGNDYQSHQSYHNADQGAGTNLLWFNDMLVFIGGSDYSAATGLTQVGGTGTLYRYNPNPTYPISPKVLPTFGAAGRFPLQNVSPTVIGNTVADNYKYCIVERIGDCYAGSTVGQIYVNIPGVTEFDCNTSSNPPFSTIDACLYMVPAWHMGIVQFGLSAANILTNGTYPTYGAGLSRVLTNGLGGTRGYSGYSHGVPLPDGSWMIVPEGTKAIDQAEQTNRTFVLVKVPPLPTTSDTTGSDFISKTITVADPADPSITNVVVEYGYREYGTPTDYYCTQRAEACYRAAQATLGFDYAADLSGVTGVSCATGCTVTLPVVPYRIAYARVVYRDAENAVVSYGNPQIVVGR